MRTKKTAAKVTFYSRYFLVPEAGIEPALPKEQDFESSASTSSATRAFSKLDGVRLSTNGCKNRELIQNHKQAAKKSAESQCNPN